MKYLISIISILICFHLPAIGQTQKVYPRNEISKDSSLVDFVSKLKNAIDRKDKEFLIESIDSNIRLFSGVNGIKEFIRKFQPDSSNSYIWMYLNRLINLGGYFSNNNSDTLIFIFPYIHSVNPDVQPKSGGMWIPGVITEKNVLVYQERSSKSKIIDTLSYDIVSIITPPQYIENPLFYIPESAIKGWITEWVRISTLDETETGFVYWDKIWSPYAYSLYLNKIKGHWKIYCLTPEMF